MPPLGLSYSLYWFVVSSTTIFYEFLYPIVITEKLSLIISWQIGNRVADHICCNESEPRSKYVDTEVPDACSFMKARLL